MITLAQAQQIADAAIAGAAAAAGTASPRVSVVVTDCGGDIRAALRSDGQGAFAIDIAQVKAQSALGFRMSTLRLSAFFGGNAPSTIGISGATGGRFVPVGGGVVVVDGEGRTVGAAAVAGGTPEADDALVRGAVSSCGLLALP